MDKKRRDAVRDALGEANNTLIDLPDDSTIEAQELRALLDAYERAEGLPDGWLRNCVWTPGDIPQTHMEEIAAESDYAVRLCADELDAALHPDT